MEVYSLAKFWNVITFVETELGHRYGHRDLPTFSFFIESTFKFLNEVEEIVFIGEFATSVRGTGVFPVEIETVELVFVHEFCKRNEFQIMKITIRFNDLVDIFR